MSTAPAALRMTEVSGAGALRPRLRPWEDGPRTVVGIPAARGTER